jgi:phenylpropionate dioxygenase-like ring-hydroxylating dioxygenase large terminal subunit
MRTVTRAIWTPVAPAKRIARHHGGGKHPYRLVLHDRTPLSVFWDTTSDTARVVSDICHHRGGSLEQGTVHNGCVTCLYHNHKTRPKKGDTIVKDGIVWYNDRSLDDIETDLHSSWEFDQDQRVFLYERDFPRCNALYMQENTLDWAHLASVHAFSFTKGLPEVVIHEDRRSASYIYETTIPDTVLEVENVFWNWNTCLRFKFGPKSGERKQAFSLHFAFVPIGKDHCKMIVRVTRCVGLWAGWVGDVALMLANELPLIEDRTVVQGIPFDRTWKDDKLTRDDAFLKLFRQFVTETQTGTASYYAGHTT